MPHPGGTPPAVNRQLEFAHQPRGEGLLGQSRQKHRVFACALTAMRIPGPTSTLRRPSHGLMPCGTGPPSSRDTWDVGARTIGRLNRACADSGTISIACTSGRNGGPAA